MISIKNTTGEAKTWHGMEIAAGATYDLQEFERPLWGNDSTVLSAIGSGEALLINNGSEVSDVAAAINILKDVSFSVFNKDRAPIFDTSLRIGRPGTETMTFTTPDFTERSTWYQKSARIENEVLTDSGDHKTFNCANEWLVDIHHNKLSLDWKKIPRRDGTLGNFNEWEIEIKVDGVPVTAGFSINCRGGSITFDVEQIGAITASYSHTDGVENPSEFLVIPPMGYRYLIEHVEMQFSRNINWTNSTLFEIWAGADLATYGDFPSYLYDAGYGQGRSIYRSTRDLINWCTNSYPIIPAPTREFEQDIFCFPFKFLVAAEMRSDQGTLIRIYLENNQEFVGEIATATLYMEMEPLS